MAKTYVQITPDEQHAALIKIQDAKIELQHLMAKDYQMQYVNPADGQIKSLFYPLSKIQEKLEYIERILKEEE